MAEAFISGTRPPDAGFATQLVQPPGALYVSPEESLVLGILTTLAGQPVTLSVRLLLADGTVQYIEHTVTAVTVGGFELHGIPLAEGFLLSVQVSHAGNFTSHGECYVYVGLARGSADGLHRVQTILADHVTDHWFPTWPQMEPTPHDAGIGQMIVLDGTDPAAGSQFTFAPSVGVRFRIIGVTMTLTTSATVANRFFRLAVTSGGNPVYVAQDTTAITASQTVIILVGPPMLATIGVTTRIMPLAPDTVIGPDTTMATSIGGLAAGDQLSGIAIFVERWL